VAALAVDPPAGQVPAVGGVITHNLTNGGADRLVFKALLSLPRLFPALPVKASNNA